MIRRSLGTAGLRGPGTSCSASRPCAKKDFWDERVAIASKREEPDEERTLKPFSDGERSEAR